MLLTKQLALVTGAAQGNGEAIAKGFAEQGASVIVTDINRQKAEGVATQINEQSGTDSAKAYAYQLDVTDRNSCQELAARIESKIGPISTLVNNAGIYVRNQIDSPDLYEAWDKALSVNLTGMMNVTIPFMDMLRRTRGSIINISSIGAFLSTKTSIAYSSSKSGITMLTKELAVELAKDGVRVNAIAPGSIATAMTEQTRSDPERYQRFLSRIPMGRFGEPKEMVGPAVFLAANQLSSYVTGTTITADGGYTAT